MHGENIESIVVDLELVPVLEQVASHGIAHVSQADESDFHFFSARATQAKS